MRLSPNDSLNPKSYLFMDSDPNLPNPNVNPSFTWLYLPLFPIDIPLTETIIQIIGAPQGFRAEHQDRWVKPPKSPI